MFRVGSRFLFSSGKKGAIKAPTLTIHVDSGVAKQPIEADQTHLSSKLRIVRPITEEEQNYELMRVKRNAGSNLRIKGKQSIQSNRKISNRQHASYDQI